MINNKDGKVLSAFLLRVFENGKAAFILELIQAMPQELKQRLTTKVTPEDIKTTISRTVSFTESLILLTEREGRGTFSLYRSYIRDKIYAVKVISTFTASKDPILLFEDSNISVY